MYGLTEMIGKVVTLRTNKGEEILAELAGMNEDKTVITVRNPMIVAYVNEQVITLPFALTADTETVHLQMVNVLAIMESTPESAEGYKQNLKEDEPQEVEVETDDA